MNSITVQIPNRIPVEVYGAEFGSDAIPLVLIHSIAMSRRLWDQQVEILSRDRPVIVYDQRGNGEAEVTPAPYSVADLGRDVVGMLDALGYARASVCGLSLGGLVAMWVAAVHPDRVDKLIVACSSAHPGSPEKWSSRAQLAIDSGMPTVIAQSSKGWFTPEFASANPAVLARLRGIAESCPPIGYAGCCAVLESSDLRPLLPSIVAPTLVLAGERDMGFPADHSAAIHEGIAGSSLVTMPGVAHIANVEAPLEFIRHVQDHLSSGR